jgi:hypothetical protein
MGEQEVQESKAEIFTVTTYGEKAAIGRYEGVVEKGGLRDGFDLFDLTYLQWYAREFGPGNTRLMLKEQAKLLNEWHEAVDALLAEMLTCTTEYTRYSSAAVDYIRSAVSEYHRIRQDFEYAVTTWVVDATVGGVDADYPPLTRSVNLMTQSLTNE